MSFKEICNELDDYFKKDEEINKVMCVKKFFSRKAFDRNTLLLIKAEALDEDFGGAFSLLLSEAGAALSVFGIMLSIISMVNSGDAMNVPIVRNSVYGYAFIIIGLMIAVGAVVYNFSRRFKKVEKWRNYVLVSIDALLEEKNNKANVIRIRKRKSRF